MIESSQYKNVSINFYRYINIYLSHMFKQNEMEYAIYHFNHWVHATEIIYMYMTKTNLKYTSN